MGIRTLFKQKKGSVTTLDHQTFIPSKEQKKRMAEKIDKIHEEIKDISPMEQVTLLQLLLDHLRKEYTIKDQRIKYKDE